MAGTKQKDPNMSNLGFQVSKETHGKLKYYATLKGVSLQEYCREVLELHVKTAGKKKKQTDGTPKE